MTNSSEIQVQLDEKTTKLAALYTQRRQFQTEAQESAEAEAVARERTRLRIADANEISGPREKCLSLRSILADVEVDIEALETELSAQSQELGRAQRIEKMAEASERAAEAARAFNAGRLDLAAHLESAFSQLREDKVRWELARGEFSALADAHGNVDPATVDPGDSSLGVGAQRQRVANARATANELEREGYDLTHVIGSLAGFSNLGQPGSGPYPTRTAKEHPFDGLINRALSETAPVVSEYELKRRGLM